MNPERKCPKWGKPIPEGWLKRICPCCHAPEIVRRALSQLQAAYASKSQLNFFEGLKSFLTRAPMEGELDVLGIKFHLTKATVSVKISRLRLRFRRLVRTELTLEQ
jgi:hypothetical protein